MEFGNSLGILRDHAMPYGEVGCDILGRLVLDSFVDINRANNLTWLEADMGSMFFMKNVLLCLPFPMVKESGYSDLPSVSNGHLNIYCSFSYSSWSRLGLPGFKPILGQVRDSFWVWFLHEKCGKLS